MLRIEFSATDLSRVAILPTSGPFAETVLGLGSLRMSPQASVAPPWRHAVDPFVRELAMFLSPRRTALLDLFTLTGPAEDFTVAARRFLNRPREQVATELWAVHRRDGVPEPSWLPGIGRAEVPARRHLVTAIRRVYERMVAPYWPAMRAALGAEHRRLQRLLTARGAPRMLSGLHPGVRWSGRTLELPAAGRWADEPVRVQLRGRGLVVLPSILGPDGPVPYFGLDGGPALLLAPMVGASADGVWWDRAGGRQPAGGLNGCGGLNGFGGFGGAGGLDALIGRTRAAALAAIADGGCTTSELAARIGTSASTASQHATVLREGGLIHSHRDGNRMLHTVNRLGHDLLAVPGCPPDGLSE